MNRILLSGDSNGIPQIPDGIIEFVKEQLPEAEILILNDAYHDGHALLVKTEDQPKYGYCCTCCGVPINKRTVLLNQEGARVRVHMWLYCVNKDLMEWVKENLQDADQQWDTEEDE